VRVGGGASWWRDVLVYVCVHVGGGASWWRDVLVYVYVHVGGGASWWRDSVTVELCFCTDSLDTLSTFRVTNKRR